MMIDGKNDGKNDEKTLLRVPVDLPELDEAEIELALSHKNQSWAHGFMLSKLNGGAEFLGGVGINLQKVSDDVVRCVAVVSDDYCFWSLMMMKKTFEAASVELELDPYTVVIPYTPADDEDEADENSGVEVA
jgi:hypothetical protein